MPDDTRADYERLIAELRGLNAGLMVTVELLEARVAVLEKAAGRIRRIVRSLLRRMGWGRGRSVRSGGPRHVWLVAGRGSSLARRVRIFDVVTLTSRSCMRRCAAVGVARTWRRRSWSGLRCVR